MEAFLVFLLATGGFVLQGLRRIPAEPPHKGIRTILGKRIGKIVGEGWRFFPIYPYWHGAIAVNVTKVDFDLPPQHVRTPDLAESSVPISISFTPDADTPQDLISFLNSGKHEAVKGLLSNIVVERLRTWAISEEEGPQTWKEMMQAGEEASAILLKAILGGVLTHIPSGIPTRVLMKFLNEPQKKPTASDASEWGANWEKVQEYWDPLSDEEKEKIKTAVQKRRAEVKTASEGNGHFKLHQFGIEINRLNVGAIKVLGEVAKAAELAAKEAREQEAEVVELKHLTTRIEELKERLKISTEQAMEFVQTERVKVVKKISEGKLNISEETRKMLENIAPGVLAALLAQKGGQQ